MNNGHNFYGKPCLMKTDGQEQFVLVCSIESLVGPFAIHIGFGESILDLVRSPSTHTLRCRQSKIVSRDFCFSLLPCGRSTILILSFGDTVKLSYKGLEGNVQNCSL